MKIKRSKQRYFLKSERRVRSIGPLKLLPGEWKGVGTGWNMIALPFQGSPGKYRILMNQYNEKLLFSFVDDNVPNRGIDFRRGFIKSDPEQFDQKLATLDYQQTIEQVVADDFPKSGLAGGKGLAIHHEPGLWLHMKDKRTNGLDIARLATVPHGNSLLALGKSKTVKGMPDIPPISGLPFGRFEDLDSGGYDVHEDRYLTPYKHYIDNPFFGNVPGNIGFPGFSPKNMNAILQFANQGVKVKKTTILTVDTEIEDGAVSNIPFVVKQAEPVSMKSTFWIQELAEKGPDGNPKLRLQYSQVVMLDFFSPREDQMPGRISWPHISINTLEKVYKKGTNY